MAFVINSNPGARRALRLSPRRGKAEGKRRDTHTHTSADTSRLNTGEKTHTLLPQLTVQRESGFNYTGRFEESLTVQPQVNGSHFRLSETFSQRPPPSRWKFPKESASASSLWEKSPWGICQWHYRRGICVRQMCFEGHNRRSWMRASPQGALPQILPSRGLLGSDYFIYRGLLGWYVLRRLKVDFLCASREMLDIIYRICRYYCSLGLYRSYSAKRLY